MNVNEIKQSQRKHEQLVYQREMFWHELKKQELIKQLLQKIYNLEDKIELLTKYSDIDSEKTIWKFELEVTGKQFINLPKGAKLLSVQTQIEKICLWALVNPNNQTEERCFELFGTGYSMHCDIDIDRNYIGTFQMQNRGLVFHLFERL